MPTSGSSHIDDHAQDTDSQTPLLKGSLPKSATVARRISLLFQNWWLWEIISATTAVLAIMVIVIILVVFDQSSLPDWPSVLTVRSIHVLNSTLLLKNCVDKLSHLLLCNNSKAVHHVGCWCLDLAIEMVMVPPG